MTDQGHGRSAQNLFFFFLDPLTMHPGTLKFVIPDDRTVSGFFFIIIVVGFVKFFKFLTLDD